MRIAIASDHAGFELKEQVKILLDARGTLWEDFGPDSGDAVDYPDFAFPLAQAVARGEFEFGILVCGTGIGMSIAANKVSGIRAALCLTPEMAAMARCHNDVNILTLGERLLSLETARTIVHTFLETAFEGDRHARRVGKITDYEEKHSVI
ncbi:MAG: ribose 5-phosphate isomerase B [Candidatus Latescibacterota bacterium]